MTELVSEITVKCNNNQATGVKKDTKKRHIIIKIQSKQ